MKQQAQLRYKHAKAPKGPAHPSEAEQPRQVPIEAPAPDTPAGPAIPQDWHKGQLLNVRAAGPGFRVTLLGEEYDPRYPERCLEFGNGFECQQFVSGWYAREAADPRAF